MEEGQRVRTEQGIGFIQRKVEVGAEIRYGVVIDKPSKEAAMIKYYTKEEIEPLYNFFDIDVALREAEKLVEFLKGLKDDYESCL